MQVVIPMSGRGQRFIDAGHREVKPLVPAAGRPMIEHVVRCFPPGTDFLFICATDHLETTPLRSVLRRLAPGAPVVGIEPHKHGPVHAALAAAEHIKDDGPVLLNYCDFAVGWDYEHFRRTMREIDPAGCLTAYRGFHPHGLGPNLHAGLRTSGNWMLEIREKFSFAADRMSAFNSSGAYYFRTGALLKDTFRRAVERDLRTNGELYASLPYNLLVEDGLPVYVYELDYFVPLGTPEDVADFTRWSDYFTRRAPRAPSLPPGRTVNVLPMVGAGARFAQAGYDAPKPLVEVAGVPMARRALDTLPAARRWVAVVRADHLAHPGLMPALAANGRAVERVVVEQITDGQARSAALGCERLTPDTPVLIAPCDVALVYDEDEWAALIASNPDCVVWTFRDHPHANRNPAQYGWCRADESGRVVEVRVKQPFGPDVRRDPGIVGAFWFRRAGDFVALTEELARLNRRVNGELYADGVAQLLVERGGDVRLFDARHYVCFGTPEDVRTFEYWERYFRAAARPALARPHLNGRVAREAPAAEPAR
jgi:NDP-sugar pyrophosphorylase family protein